MLEEQIFDSARHDRKGFASGVQVLDDYLKRLAAQQQSKGITSLYVLVDSEQPDTILGFYTLSAAQIDVEQLDKLTQKKLPKYPIPCFRLGRLAVDISQQSKGLGKLLIGCAVERCLAAKQIVAAYALIVDAKDERAKSFYEHFGFTACTDLPMTLYLPLGM